MTEIEQKALALVNELLRLKISVFSRSQSRIHEALCRAIEQHEAFRQEVSDAVLSFWPTKPPPEQFSRFIIAKPDPVRVLAEVLIDCGLDPSEGWPDEIRAAMKARGYEWRKIEGEG